MTRIHPKYDIRVNERIKVMKLVLDRLDIEEKFLFDGGLNRWLAPIKVLTEETFNVAKGLGVAFVRISPNVDEKEWYFDSRFVMDHGSAQEKDNMRNLINVLNEKKKKGQLVHVT